MAEVHEPSTSNPEVDFLTGALADDLLPDAADGPWLAGDKDKGTKETTDKKDEKDKDEKDKNIEKMYSKRCP